MLQRFPGSNCVWSRPRGAQCRLQDLHRHSVPGTAVLVGDIWRPGNPTDCVLISRYALRLSLVESHSSASRKQVWRFKNAPLLEAQSIEAQLSFA